jgi:hypothetical protein
MSLFKRLSERSQAKKDTGPTLMGLFLELEGTPEFPFDLAMATYQSLSEQSQGKTEFTSLLLEDIIFSSLYATYYEEILNTIYENPQITIELVNSFSEDQEVREQEVAEQTQAHLQYVLNLGKCAGCLHCDHHEDVQDLIQYWRKQDFTFFSTLYLGMQTIQFSMEHVLYDVLPIAPENSSIVERSQLLKFRQNIYDDVEKRINS